MFILDSDFDPFQTFMDQGIIGYPYYYLVDLYLVPLFSPDLLQGFVGTGIWQPDSLHYQQYDEYLQEIVRNSTEIVNRLENKWEYYYS